MNLVGYPLTCRLSWTWDVSSVLRASLEGMVFARCINVQNFIKILNIFCSKPELYAFSLELKKEKL